jgi:hypothetical protein
LANPAYQDQANPENRRLRDEAERLYRIGYPDTDGQAAVSKRPAAGGVTPGSSHNETKRQIKEILANPAYRDRKHPDNRALRQRAARLYVVAFPDER